MLAGILGEIFGLTAEFKEEYERKMFIMGVARLCKVGHLWPADLLPQLLPAVTHILNRIKYHDKVVNNRLRDAAKQEMKLNSADDDSDSEDDDYDGENDFESDSDDSKDGDDNGMSSPKEEKKEDTKLGFVDDVGTGLVDFECTLGMVDYPRKAQNPNANFTEALRQLSQTSPQIM